MICDPWVDRSGRMPRPPRVFKTSQEDRTVTKVRQDMLRAAGKCINGPLDGFVSKRRGIVHGPVVSPCGRCARCLAVKRGKSS